MSRTFEEKRMGLPAAEDFGPADQEKFDDKMAFQLLQYRSRNLDQKLVKLGRELVENVFPDDFNATELTLKHEIAACYLHSPAVSMHYRRLPIDRYHTGRDKPCWYSIPELPIEKCEAVLRKFGMIE